MYHAIADPPADAAWPHLYVSPAELRAQLAWLDRHGFTAVTLSDVWRNWHHRGRLPERPVVLTFDDGYRSVAVEALPLLQARGWPAVLNLKVGNIGRDGLSERHVGKLLAAGWDLAAHTLTHPDLRTLDDAALEREVAGSRSELRRRLAFASTSSATRPAATTRACWLRCVAPASSAPRRPKRASPRAARIRCC